MLRKRTLLPLFLLAIGLAGCMSQSREPTAIWVADALEPLGPDTAPRLETELYSASRSQLTLEAAINETIAFQVVLRPAGMRDGPFQITLSSLAGSTGELDSASTFRIFRGQYVRVAEPGSWYSAHVGEPISSALVLDKLVPWDAPVGGGPLVLAESRNETIWVDLHVPSETEPGTYRGSVSIEKGGSPLAKPREVWRSDVVLEVLPVTLPAERSLAAICRVEPSALLHAQLRWPEAQPESTRLLSSDADHQPAIELVNQTMRLFQSHRTNPVLWASFPSYAPAASGDRNALDVRWDDYDTLVERWLDGSAFDDRQPLDYWLVPASVDYPGAERNGGLASAGYGALFSAYLKACRAHFEARGWLDRALVRPVPPGGLTPLSVEQNRLAEQLVRRAAVGIAPVAHLPLRSLRGLGWVDAPAIQGVEAAVWAPPAGWLEPEEIERHRGDGRGVWFMPDRPPYSGSLAPEAPPTDARIIPWLAYRYGVDGVWIEDAARPGAGLVYAGVQHGLVGEPLPSMRLKRLLRGLQDYELLKLLERDGRQLLARRIAEQVVRWGFTDACRDNLIDTKETGWSTTPETLRLARRLILSELAPASTFPDASGTSGASTQAAWNVLFNRADRVRAAVEGIRIQAAGGDLTRGVEATIHAAISNATDRPLEGVWRMTGERDGWTLRDSQALGVPPGARRASTLAMDVRGWGQNTTGAYPVELSFETGTLGTFAVAARLAAATCGEFAKAPSIDGRLDDWPLAATNVMGDFQLVRGARGGARTPALGTMAFLGLDETSLYVSVRAALRPGERPTWASDNRFAVDGAIPWGQDIVELLIDPGPDAGGSSGQIYCVRVKPSGVFEATLGAPTSPPMGAVRPWTSGIRVASRIERDVWVTEMAIPLESFEPAALERPIWGMNVARLDARRGEYTSWSGAQGYCYAPRSLGNVMMLWPK